MSLTSYLAAPSRDLEPCALRRGAEELRDSRLGSKGNLEDERNDCEHDRQSQALPTEFLPQCKVKRLILKP